MTAHSKLGASSMYRWSACPGSVRQSEGIPNYSSSYASEGTSAHYLAAHCLNNDLFASSLIGAKMTDDRGTDFTVTADMADAVDVYIEAVHEFYRPEEGDILHVEVRFDLSRVYPNCFGTSDTVIWKPKSKLLIVPDYKHGAGTPVAVKGNVQLRYYATGALLQLGYPATKVKLVIVQPRCKHADGSVRSETIDALDLVDFCGDLITAAKATEAPDAPLVTGSWCFFCPVYRAKTCPAIEQNTQAKARSAFTPVQP